MNPRTRLVATGLPAGAISTTTSRELSQGWTLVSTRPGAFDSPADLSDDLGWSPAVVPGTVALSIGPEDLDGHEDYDASDWWYRCLVTPPAGAGRVCLRFDGLATLAQVWLNGQRVLDSSNMFLQHEVDVTDLVREENELAVVFRSLGTELAERRPRPRWKTNLIDEQQLRWFRTTLLGRIPAWTPAIHPVGPWRSVWIERKAFLDLERLDVRASMSGDDGLVEVDARLGFEADLDATSATLEVGNARYPLEMRSSGDHWTAGGTVRVPGPERWWPATHGKPTLHDCSILIETSNGPVRIDCGRIGFRDIRLDTSHGRIQFVINGVRIFCRGACWTSNDIVSLVGPQDRMRRLLEQAVSAHANMVRVGGTMVYESDDFYGICDELGLMVWQDFMFANMDYPTYDEPFAGSARAEADQQLRRISRHACAVAFCGGSEVEQQAAMFGAAREIWSHEFFADTLSHLVESYTRGAPYWPSTPTGGALPFHVGEGLTHYYGVGAYKREVSDVRLAGVKFAPECLGFSHVPEAENLTRLTPHGAVAPHHPAWKRGVPRDAGSGWDFEDIRDFYLERLYGVDAVQLRSEDLARYLELSRVITGEVMEAVFAEWRRDEDPCGGALTWFLADLRPGAGWGLVDSDGRPKSALHHLRRSWTPRCIRLLDRGLDGLRALVVNEAAEPLSALVNFCVIGHDGRVLTKTSRVCEAAPRSSIEMGVEETFGYFLDSTFSYRFGPARHQAVVARLVTSAGEEVVSEAVYRPRPSAASLVDTIDARIAAGPDGELVAHLSTNRILYDVRLDVRDHAPDDDHFILTPGRSRAVTLRATTAAPRSFRGYVGAANLAEAVRLEAP